MYLGSRILSAVRDRIWSVLSDTFPNEVAASIVMVLQNRPRLEAKRFEFLVILQSISLR